MTLNIKYITTKDHKHLLWTMDEDDMFKCKISKITVCDCFLEWGIAFLRKYSDVTLSNHFMRVFLIQSLLKLSIVMFILCLDRAV